VLRAGGLEMDHDRYTVALHGKLLRLTPNEFKLLSLLARHPGQTLTREQIADELHGLSFPGLERSIDSHVKKLRRKLESAGAHFIIDLPDHGDPARAAVF
jgi:DNA-binding response OmpR family regulator